MIFSLVKNILNNLLEIQEPFRRTYYINQFHKNELDELRSMLLFLRVGNFENLFPKNVNIISSVITSV